MEAFYDAMAEYQHLIFKDWNWSVEWQSGVFGDLLERYAGHGVLKVLDCACGIGTQILGLSRLGHEVTGTDLSFAAIARARREAKARGLPVKLAVADMTNLQCFRTGTFDAVIAVDNALPHLRDVRPALEQIGFVLKSGGVFIATIRDYDAILSTHPAVDPPRFFDDNGRRRISHQVWDWIDDRTYKMHQYITFEADEGWRCVYATSTYHCIRRDELTSLMPGFEDVQWLTAAEARFYQPVLVARKRG